MAKSSLSGAEEEPVGETVVAPRKVIGPYTVADFTRKPSPPPVEESAAEDGAGEKEKPPVYDRRTLIREELGLADHVPLGGTEFSVERRFA